MAEGCFFLDDEAGLAAAVGVVVAVVAVGVAAPLVVAAKDAFAAAAGSGAVSSVRGFIWMILRDLVGGGGKAKVSFWATDERLLDLTTSLAWTG